MCTKLEIYAKSGKENEYYLEDNLRCKATSSMTLNNARCFGIIRMFDKTLTIQSPMEAIRLRLMRDIGRLI